MSPPHTRLTMVLFILIPKQITGVAIPLLHGVVVITSETTTTLHMQDRVATICASNIVIFPTDRVRGSARRRSVLRRLV